MTAINIPAISLEVAVGENDSFVFIITPIFTFSSPEQFRWEIVGQGEVRRGIISFQAGEEDSRSIPWSIDPDESYRLRVYRITDNNNDEDDELLFQQQSEVVASSPEDAPQRAGIEGDLGAAKIMKVNASFVYNLGEAINVVIDATSLFYNHSTGDELTYTLTATPTGGDLFRDGVKLTNGDTFTQSDINDGLIRFTATSESAISITFTVSDGTISLQDQILQITPREDHEVDKIEQANIIDLSEEPLPQKIKSGDGNDTITGGPGDDQIDGGAGNDTIILTRDVKGSQVDAGVDEVLYRFSYDGVGLDGGDRIEGFRRGQDKLIFTARTNSEITTLTEFLQSLNGSDGKNLTADDAFTVTMLWGMDENGEFYFDGIMLHFREAGIYGNGRIASPFVTILFDERLDFDDLIEILGGKSNVANNFDFTHAAFKNLDEVLPRLFGENSIDFDLLPLNKISVMDGPVLGAEVFFDLNNDGEITDTEKDTQRDKSGRSRYITDEDGTVEVLEKYIGLAFVADVDGAYDIGTGERLEGAFRSLDDGEGGIATPITDLIATYLEEVDGQASVPTTEQETLDLIFGDDVIMVADILDMDNYEVTEDGVPGAPKALQIIKVAIALTEIKKDDTLAGGDGSTPVTKAKIVETIRTLLITPDDPSVARLKSVVAARVREAYKVKGGKPIATPDEVETLEDTDYAFPDTPKALTELFGFLDPGGNKGANTSALRGIYIKIDIKNASLWLDDGTTKVTATTASTLKLGGSDNAPPVAGYIYITIDKLDELKVRPDSDFSGVLNLIYRVWDGEKSSSDAELIITVTEVSDDPAGYSSVSVIGGPVLGAEIFFDLNDDGEITDAEKDTQRDGARARYITGEDGTVLVLNRYVGLAFVADVDGAYDTGSGTRLEGSLRSLDDGEGGIATPITDLIVTYLEEVEGQAGTPTTALEVLNEIFGDGVITVEDILDTDNYEVFEDGVPPDPTNKMIITVAFALSEIKKDDTLAGGDGTTAATNAEIITVINTLLTAPGDSSVARLKSVVAARIREAQDVKGGQPIGLPNDVETPEDTDVEFPDTLESLTEFFGFLDPSGNKGGVPSAFKGVYIKIDIKNASLWLDDGTTEVTATTASTLKLGGSDNAPSVAGYVYITIDKLDELKLRPASDFSGEVKLVYQVWDGEQSSSDAELTVTVTEVNDDPTTTSVSPQINVAGQAGGAIDLSTLFEDPDDDELTLTVTVVLEDGSETTLKAVGLSYDPDTNLLSSTPKAVGTYTIKVVASDGHGGRDARAIFTLKVIEANESPQEITGNNLDLVDLNDPGFDLPPVDTDII